MRMGSTRADAKRRLIVAGCTFLAPLALVATTFALFAPTVLNFENLPAGTTVTTQFSAQGVTFQRAFIGTDLGARSGTRALRTISPSSEVFTPIPLKMEFTRSQRRVKLFATSPGIPRNGTLRAFSVSGELAGTDGPKLVAANSFSTMFEIRLSLRRIKRLELHLDGAAHFAIDDLEFDIEPSKPTVTVTDVRQPAAKDNKMVSGTFTTPFRLGKPPDVIPTQTVPPEDEKEERINFESARAVEKDLAPGASAELVTRLTGRNGLFGAVRWTGTSAPLRVTLLLNGSRLDSGRTYSTGPTRGGADVGGMATNGGEVKLSVTNTSSARVKVRLMLRFVRAQTR